MFKKQFLDSVSSKTNRLTGKAAVWLVPSYPSLLLFLGLALETQK